MRKKAALFLAVLLGIGVLSGCTPAELEYLELSREMNRMVSGELSGQAELEIDVNAFMQAISGAEDPAANNANKNQLLLGEDGKRNLTVKWDGAYDRSEGFREQLHVQCSAEGVNWDLGTIYMDITTGDITVSKDGVLAFLDLLQTFDFDDSDCYAYTKEYKEALTQELKDCKFITWNFYGDGSTRELLQKTFSSVLGAAGEESKIEEAARTFLREAHTDYSSGLLQKVGRGYRLNMTLGQLPELLNGYLTYIENHSEAYRSALNAYLAVCMKEAQSMMSGVLLEQGVGLDAANGEMNIGEEDFAEAVASFGAVKETLASLADDETFKRFADSYYTMEVSKPASGVYESKADIGLLFDKTKLASLSVSSHSRAAAATVQMPEAQMDQEQLSGILEQLADRYNPVNALVLEWEDFDSLYSDFGADDSMMWAEQETEQREPIWRSQGIGGLVSYEDRGGRLYVKLADVCSMLRLSPQWNGNVEKAYVQVGERFVYLEGYQRQQSTWIAVRELEKLGYGVSYERVDGTNIVTVYRLEKEK